MKLPKKFLYLLVGLLTGAVVATGATVAVTAGASTANPKYYACLAGGKLSNVGTVTVVCTAPAKLITWNAVGPAGKAGLQGPPGPPGSNGVTYDCSATPYPGVDLAGCDLSNRDLTGANLLGANLTGANLQNATLTGATLRGADVGGADFTGAALTGVRSGDIVGSPAALPFQWFFINGYLLGQGADLTNANLKGMALSQINLTGATLTGVRSGGVTGTPALPTNWSLQGGYLWGPGADLSGETTGGAVLTNAKLAGINVRNAYLANTDFTSADLTGANFSGSRLVTDKFSFANLTNSSFANATLDVSFFFADMFGADVTGVTWGSTTCPDGTFADKHGNTCVGHGGGL